MAEPFKALADPRTRETTLQFAAQLGKNLMAEIWVGFLLGHAPGNILVHAQTDDDASLFARDRLLKRLKEIEALRPLYADQRGTFHIDKLFLPHMYLLAHGANESNLQGKSARYQCNDELHLWPEGMLDQARDRASAFWDAKILNTSTAGNEGSEQDRAYNDGTQEVYHAGCPDCGRLVRPRWSAKPRVIVWDTTNETRPEGKRWNLTELGRTIRFVCPYCDAEHPDSFDLRVAMAQSGDYIPDNPDAPPDRRTFQVSQLVAPWVTWQEIVERWIKAIDQLRGGNIELLRNFTVKRLAETWENRTPSGTRAVVTGGYSLAHEFRWPDEAQRFLTVDVQSKGGRHFWCVLRAWSQTGGSRLIHAQRAETWSQVKATQDLYNIPPGRVMVDCRHSPREVLEACATYGWTWLEADEKAKHYPHQHGRWTIYRPFSTMTARDPGLGTATQGRSYAYGYRFSKAWARDTIHRLMLGQGTPWELPDDAPDFYLDQLNSWIPASKEKPNGDTEHFWKKINRDDHCRACEEMQIIGAALQGLTPAEVADPEPDSAGDAGTAP